MNTSKNIRFVNTGVSYGGMWGNGHTKKSTSTALNDSRMKSEKLYSMRKLVEMLDSRGSICYTFSVEELNTMRFQHKQNTWIHSHEYNHRAIGEIISQMTKNERELSKSKLGYYR